MKQLQTVLLFIEGEKDAGRRLLRILRTFTEQIFIFATFDCW